MQQENKIYKPLFKLALPLIIVQLCQASLGLVDTLVAGQYHYADLAGVGLGSALWTPVLVFFTGVLYVIVPKFSAFGHTNNSNEPIELFNSAKKTAFWLSIVGFILIQLLAVLSPLMIEDDNVASITRNYLHFIAFAIPSLVFMILYRFVSEGNSRLTPILVAGILLLLINTVFNVIFVKGLFGLPALGGAGCGLASALSTFIALLIIRFSVRKELPHIVNASVQPTNKPDGKALLIEGLPIGFALVLEVLALTALAFFVSKLGVKEIAAHQIAINIAIVIFMIPVAFSSAATIRVAHFHGSNDMVNRKKSAYAALAIASVYGIITTLLLLGFGKHVLSLFSNEKDVIIIASGLLLYIAAFQLFDAIQMVAAGILRGLQEFVKPLLVIVFTYWVLVIPLSYFIGVKGWLFNASIETIWLILSFGLVFAAFALLLTSYKALQTNPSP